jgi:hypothetical protein
MRFGEGFYVRLSVFVVQGIFGSEPCWGGVHLKFARQNATDFMRTGRLDGIFWVDLQSLRVNSFKAYLWMHAVSSEELPIECFCAFVLFALFVPESDCSAYHNLMNREALTSVLV